MITVVTFLWGQWELPDGGVSYVHALANGVARHCKTPYRFVVFTDREQSIFKDGIEALPLGDAQYLHLNLKKMVMFNKEAGLTGRILACDLDTIVMGDFTQMVNSTVQAFTTCECPYHLRWIGGGIHSFDAGWGHDELWNPVASNPDHWRRVAKGSERLYLSYRFRDVGIAPDFWQRRFPGQVLSYKTGCMDKKPKDVKLVWFHGVPRPHQCLDRQWVRDNWLNGLNGSIRAEESGDRESLGSGVLSPYRASSTVYGGVNE